MKDGGGAAAQTSGPRVATRARSVDQLQADRMTAYAHLAGLGVDPALAARWVSGARLNHQRMAVLNGEHARDSRQAQIDQMRRQGAMAPNPSDDLTPASRSTIRSVTAGALNTMAMQQSQARLLEAAMEQLPESSMPPAAASATRQVMVKEGTWHGNGVQVVGNEAFITAPTGNRTLETSLYANIPSSPVVPDMAAATIGAGGPAAAAPAAPGAAPRPGAPGSSQASDLAAVKYLALGAALVGGGAASGTALVGTLALHAAGSTLLNAAQRRAAVRQVQRSGGAELG